MNDRKEYTMILETKRLILRELTENDFSDLFEVLSDSDVTAALSLYL